MQQVMPEKPRHHWSLVGWFIDNNQLALGRLACQIAVIYKPLALLIGQGMRLSSRHCDLRPMLCSSRQPRDYSVPVLQVL